MFNVKHNRLSIAGVIISTALIVLTSGFFSIFEAKAQSLGFSVGYNNPLILTSSNENLIYGLMSATSTAGSFLKLQRFTAPSTFQDIFVIDYQGNITSTGVLSGSNTVWTPTGNNIYNSNSGNVGIGLTNPNSKFFVNGTASIGSGNYYGRIYSWNPGSYFSDTPNFIISNVDSATTTAASYPQLIIHNHEGTIGNFSGIGFSAKESNSGGNQVIGAAIMTQFVNKVSGGWVSGDLHFITKNQGTMNDAMVVRYNGNVGIGTTGPGSKLAIGTYASNYINSATLPNTPANHLINLAPPSTYSYYGGGISWSEGTNTAASINAYDDGAVGALGLVFATGDNTALTERVRITTAGNIGIGSTTPVAKLAVSGGTGNVIYAGGGQIAGLNSTPINSDQAVPLGYLQANYTPSGTAAGGVGNGTSGQTLRHNGTSWIANSTIYNNGTNVGIGTTNPGVALHVKDVSAASYISWASPGVRIEGTWPSIVFSSATSDAIIRNAESSQERGLQFAVNNVKGGTFERALHIQGDGDVVMEGGNVGIGTTVPNRLLHVSSVNSSFLNLQITKNDSAHTQNVDEYGIEFSTNDADWQAAKPVVHSSIGVIPVNNPYGNTYDMAFRTGYTASSVDYANVEALRIKYNGNIGIGLTNPTQKLEVSGIIKTNSNILQGNTINRSLVSWSQSGAATGAVIITLPGTAGSNHGMVQMEINVYEYSSNSATTFICGGHNWNTQWYNYNCSSIGLSNKKVRLGVKDGKYVVIIGEQGAAWSYGHVVLSKITNPEFYSGNLDLSGPYTITLDNNTEAYTWVSPDLNRLNARNAYFSGNVGIGTTNPISKLYVNGSVALGTGNYYGRVYSWNPGSYYVDAPNAIISNANSATTTATSYPQLIIHNHEGTINNFAGIGFSARESNSGGNQVMGAAIMTQFVNKVSGGWVSGDLHFITKNQGTMNDAMVVRYNGNVGIGTASPGQKLDVGASTSDYIRSYGGFVGSSVANIGGTGAAAYFPSGVYISGSTSWIYGTINFNNTIKDNQATPRWAINPAGLSWFNGGNVGIGSTTPVAKLAVSGGTGNVIYTGGGQVSGLPATQTQDDQAVSRKYLHDNFAPAGSGYLPLTGGTMSGDINMGSKAITNVATITAVKLNVNTIDPLYSINGKKYSTYVASIVGRLREEYIGRLNITERLKDMVGVYEGVIDFDKEDEGSDLWVWREVVDFQPNNVDVLITPYGGFAQVYYIIDGNKIRFRSDRPAEISYRLVGHRFDWREWPTFSSDQSQPGYFVK